MAESRIEGLATLRARLLALPKEIRGRPLLDALFSAGKPIRDEAQRLAPHRTGRLAINIVLARAGARDGVVGDAGVVVTVRRTGKASDPRNAFYAKFVEFGHLTRPSAADARGQRRLRRRNALGETFELTLGGRRVGYAVDAVGKVRHLVPPRPFLRPAADQQREQAFRAFAESLRRGLDDAVKRLGGRVG